MNTYVNQSINTLNVCIGHIPFPVKYAHYVDLMLSPSLLSVPYVLKLIPHERLGHNGGAFADYSQFLWLYKEIDSIIGSKEYIRIFHYRRFVGLPNAGPSAAAVNQPWSQHVKEESLHFYESCFTRCISKELFNTPTNCMPSVLHHYVSHSIYDYIRFANFLLDHEILEPKTVADFMTTSHFIPVPNIGVFSLTTFLWLGSVLEQAANFFYSAQYIPRDGGQRRNMGFLLERLTSFLLLDAIKSGRIPLTFGQNYIISDSSIISPSS